MASLSDAAAKQDFFMEEEELINFNDPNTPHDKIIAVQDKKFHIQSFILSMSSPVFRVLFNSDFSEANQEEITLQDVDPVHFEYFLRMIYPSHLVVPVSTEYFWYDESLPLGLMSISHRFLCRPIYQVVKKYIDERVAQGLEGLNLIEFANIAVLHDIEEYKKMVIKFLKDPSCLSKNREQIKKAPDHVTKFLLDALIDEKLQPEKSSNVPSGIRYAARGSGLAASTSSFRTSYTGLGTTEFGAPQPTRPHVYDSKSRRGHRGRERNPRGGYW